MNGDITLVFHVEWKKEWDVMRVLNEGVRNDELFLTDIDMHNAPPNLQ